MNRDVITIGASAGGVEVLLNLASALPAGLPAAILVAIHTPPDARSLLPDLLSRRGPLEALHPIHHQAIVPGKIYVAPPDTQLLVRPGRVEVVRGPRENGHRPAIDVLFRSASAAYGPRVIGVVLSGYGDCGTAGTLSIKARGGAVIAQAPESAVAKEMPRSAIERGAVDRVVLPAELPAVLERLVSEPITGESAPVSQTIAQLEGTARGSPAELVCPTCQGVLTEARAGEFQHFRCHVGHAFSLSSLAQEQGESLERALWAAVRALEESAALSRRLSASNDTEFASRFTEREQTHTENAELIRQLLLRNGGAAGSKP